MFTWVRVQEEEGYPVLPENVSFSVYLGRLQQLQELPENVMFTTRECDVLLFTYGETFTAAVDS